MLRVLLVEDSRLSADPIIEIVDRIEYSIEWVQYVDDARNIMKSMEFDVVLLDMQIFPNEEYVCNEDDRNDPIRWGMKLLKEIRSEYPNLPLIVISQWLEPDWRKNFIYNEGVFELIEKGKRGDTYQVLDDITMELRKIEFLKKDEGK